MITWEKLPEERRKRVIALLSLAYHVIGEKRFDAPEWPREAAEMREGLDAAVAFLQEPVWKP